MIGRHPEKQPKESALPKTKKKDSVEQIVAKAFAHPLRVQILIILNERVASPNLLSQELEQNLNLVAYHVRVLEKYDCIELVDTKQRRGATEHFYRATRRQFLSNSEWARMPAALRPGLSGAMLKAVFDDIEEAVNKDTFDELEDRHLSRTPMVVDKQGWNDVATLLGETLDRVLEIQAEASERIANSDEPGMLSKVEMLHFKSPEPEAEAEPEVEADSESAAPQ
ncbi:MAG TPA: winged helix-turn-helix domain-containing protein [Solirubrobacterales bacterium]|nr:winged helix-turn-helix domain-containing protein [Solirubrobacterales bacterium]